MWIEAFDPTREAAAARLRAVCPEPYARSRNALDGAVTRLSPYITHGLLSLPEVLAAVNARAPMHAQHKLVYELGWREYFRHVWTHRGPGILDSLHAGPLPETDYDRVMPQDIRQAATGVPVIDMAVRTLYETGYLHNHARMWLASYVVHLRKVHWRTGADWLYGHLLDGDLASNHLSWQWVAGTASNKPYVFNAENVARHAPPAWHSPGSVIDQSREALERLARQAIGQTDPQPQGLRSPSMEPALHDSPPAEGLCTPLDASMVAGRDVWLVHPWCLGDVPAHQSGNAVVVGVLVAEFHRDWPWSAKRWDFVGKRMAEMTDTLWYADAATITAALHSAGRVRSIDEPHLQPWLDRWAVCDPAPKLFPRVDKPCDSFSQWWRRASAGIQTAAELVDAHQTPQSLRKPVTVP